MSITWCCGVTATPQRLQTHLPVTLNSLKRAGFEDVVVFLDGPSPSPLSGMPVEVVARPKALGAFGNFALSLWELYVRQPTAQRFAVFQDDLLACKNLRQFLEQFDFPPEGYINLYSVHLNAQNQKGWSLSDQMGRGAVALMFNNSVVRRILAHPHFVDHPQNGHNGHKGIDRVVSETSKKLNIREWVHVPGLIQHIGLHSTTKNKLPPEIIQSPIFVGEDFDAMEMAQ